MYDYLPETFREKIVARIQERKEVRWKEALELVKRTDDCEEWLLANGGEGWVSVVRDKHKRRHLINQVFEQEFPVVEKITT